MDGQSVWRPLKNGSESTGRVNEVTGTGLDLRNCIFYELE